MSNEKTEKTEYEILDPEQDKSSPDEDLNAFVRVMEDAQKNIDSKLDAFGISPDLDISEEDAALVARSMLNGTLDDTLRYIREKYIEHKEPRAPELPPSV